MEEINPEKKQALLDFFLVSEESFELVYDCNQVSGYRTDHSGIILKLKLNQNERGKSYCKFNNSRLKDKDYIQLVKKSIEEVKNTYKIVNIQHNNKIIIIITTITIMIITISLITIIIIIIYIIHIL